MDKKMKIKIGIVGIIIVALALPVSVTISNMNSEPSGSEKIIKVTQSLSASYYNDNPSDIKYQYSVGGEAINLKKGSYSENYMLKAYFYNSNNKLVDEKDVTLYFSSLGWDTFYITSYQKSKIDMNKVVLELINPDGDVVTNYTQDINMDIMGEPKGHNRTSTSSTNENNSGTGDNANTSSSTSSGTADAGWKTVTMQYPSTITSSDGAIYRQGYRFGFQISGDSSATQFVVPSSLYNKFSQYKNSNTIKIKYRSGTAKADNGVGYPINIVTDVKSV